MAQCGLEVVELGADYLPKGPPRRLIEPTALLGTRLAWTRDGTPDVWRIPG